MVRVVAEKFALAKEVDDMLIIVQELINETRKEEGCIYYGFHQNEKDPTHFSFIETWETREHLDAHFESEHFKRLVPMLESIGKPGPVVIYNEKI